MKANLGLSTLLLVSTFCFAVQPDRIPGTINSGETVVLAGNVAAEAQDQYDRGLVELSMPMPYIVMQTQPSVRQQAALNRLLAEQQDPASANYHKWLTPEQYADRFGLNANDMGKVADWLKTQGFGIVQTARGRDWIAFSGNAGLVERAFQTEIHYYEVDGETHFANATPLSIPKALDGIVAGFRGMHDFSLRPMGVHQLPAWEQFFASIVHPFYNAPGGYNLLAPGDIATIYNIAPLYSAGINGTGQKLVVVGQTDVHMTDIEQFRSNFGLPKNDPQVKLVPGSPDPGVIGDEIEADLDLEWSGAVARNATILFVVSSVSAGGVFNSASYAIDQDLASVISMSYGGCESANQSFIPTNEPTMQKASAEGITFLASSGDSGAAGCDSDRSGSAAQGLAVVYPASSPEVTGVGGNEFNEGGGNYWGSNGTHHNSALSYIPEVGWNDTGENGSLSASGGGASSCHTSGCSSGFPKPSWQSGFGVPNDAVRDVPDVALTASANHDGYMFCSADNGANCANGTIVDNEAVGGTSASTPVFAGIVTLLNQQLGNKPPAGVGNINSNLYTLAQNTSNGIFHDVTSGDNMVPCIKGTKDCPNGGSIGYDATAGYDQVTGLGSVDANKLVTGFSAAPTTTALASDTNPANSGATVTFTATVTGSNSPTGTVTFLDGSTQIGTPQTLSSGVATLPYSGLSVGGHSIAAAYGGDKKNAPSTSSILTETILGTGTTQLTSFVISADQGTAPYGTSINFNANISPGNATGTVTFIDNSTTPIGFATLSNGFAMSPSFLLSVGTHSITGLYSGDSTYGSSTSPAIQQVVVKATPSVNGAISPGSVNVKSTGRITMGATIAPNGPTGIVNFLVNGSLVGHANIGSTFAYNPGSLASGIYSVTASYPGDSNFNPSSSPTMELDVQDFQLSPNPKTVTISAPGKSGSTTLTITPLGNFNQQLVYSCAGLPTMAECSATANPSGTETVTITTAAPIGFWQYPVGKGSGIFYALLLPGLLILPAGTQKLSRRRVLSLLALLVAILLLMPGCGGGGGSSSGGGIGNGGTPTGSSTVTITASTIGVSPLSHSVNITLNVQ